MDIFMSVCYPRLLPSLIAHLQEVTEEQEHLKNHEGLDLSQGLGLFFIFPDLGNCPALVIPCLCPFSNSFSCSYLHPPFISFTPSLALHSCTFWQILSPVLTRDFPVSHSNPQLIAVVPFLPTYNCKWISLTPWDLETSSVRRCHSV